MSLQAPESRFSKIQTGIFTYTRLFREAFPSKCRHKNPEKRLQNYLQLLLLMINFTAPMDNIIPFKRDALTKLNLLKF